MERCGFLRCLPGRLFRYIDQTEEGWNLRATSRLIPVQEEEYENAAFENRPMITFTFYTRCLSNIHVTVAYGDRSKIRSVSFLWKSQRISASRMQGGLLSHGHKLTHPASGSIFSKIVPSRGSVYATSHPESRFFVGQKGHSSRRTCTFSHPRCLRTYRWRCRKRPGGAQV